MEVASLMSQMAAIARAVAIMIQMREIMRGLRGNGRFSFLEVDLAAMGLTLAAALTGLPQEAQNLVVGLRRWAQCLHLWDFDPHLAQNLAVGFIS